MAWLKKKKPKAGLEIPPPPQLDDVPAFEEEPEKMDIPETFHEIRGGKSQPVESKKEETIQPPDEGFKTLEEIENPDIPEMPELPDIPEMPKVEETKPKILEGPIFVKSRDYQGVLVKINKIKESVQHTDDVFKRMDEIRNEKDKIFSEWKKSLEDIQRKMIFIEKSLYEV